MPISDELMRAVQQERRERIATAVLGHILAHEYWGQNENGHCDRRRAVGVAVGFADYLIAELDKEPSR